MHFSKLQVWQRARELAVAVYRVTRQGELARDFALRDQMQRAAVPIASNIAEGYARDTAKDRCHFLIIARGSCAELQTQFEIASAVGLVAADMREELVQGCDEISRMLTGLIKTLREDS